jgi:hypothetical protein
LSIRGVNGGSGLEGRPRDGGLSCAHERRY